MLMTLCSCDDALVPPSDVSSGDSSSHDFVLAVCDLNP
jgi:hypothetical protein